MWQDPIVKEVREIREKYASRLKHNPETIFEDICKRQGKPGKLLVELSPRKPRFKKKQHSLSFHQIPKNRDW